MHAKDTKGAQRTDTETSSDNGADLLERDRLAEEAQLRAAEKVGRYIEEKVHKDTSPAARAARRKMMMRAIYGEFMCTFIFFTTVFAILVNAHKSKWSADLTTVVSAFNASFQGVAVMFAFSSVSGAHFNPSISFALWLTGKLSNRKCVSFILAQLLASVIAMATVLAMFHGNESDILDVCVVNPPDDDDRLGRVFATEFILTFIFVYVAFTVVYEDVEKQKVESMSIKTIQSTRGLTLYAATPQSKTGFAPFAIGFTIFSLALVGGSSGGAFNQARLFGPALLRGNWTQVPLYFIAEFLGGATAALMVHNLHRVGLNGTTGIQDTVKSPPLEMPQKEDKGTTSPMVLREV